MDGIHQGIEKLMKSFSYDEKLEYFEMFISWEQIVKKNVDGTDL